MCGKHKLDDIIKCIVLLSSLLLHSLPLIGLVVCFISRSLLFVCVMMIIQSTLTMTMKSSSWPIELNRAGYSSPHFSFLCVCDFLFFFVRWFFNAESFAKCDLCFGTPLLSHSFFCISSVGIPLVYMCLFFYLSYILAVIEWMWSRESTESIKNDVYTHSVLWVFFSFKFCFVYCVVCATNVDERPRMLCAFLR